MEIAGFYYKNTFYWSTIEDNNWLWVVRHGFSDRNAGDIFCADETQLWICVDDHTYTYRIGTGDVEYPEDLKNNKHFKILAKRW